MKIVNVIGGLGNQMFQYAFAVALHKKNPEERVLIDTQHYKFPFIKKINGNNFYHNGFEIYDVFPNANIPIAGFWDIIKLSYYIPNYIISRIARRFLPVRKKEYVLPVENYFSYDSNAYSKKGDCYYEGVWSSIHYFENIEEELRQQFSFGNLNSYNTEMVEKINSTHSVAIHIRRGDYVGAQNFKDICTLGYYKNAIDKILELINDPTFFIFSNDINWCKTNISPIIDKYPIIYVDGNKGKNSPCDMFLMSKCEAQILANSSFSWWSAFLNVRANTVIVPSRWINRSDEVDLYKDSWIKIKV